VAAEGPLPGSTEARYERLSRSERLRRGAAALDLAAFRLIRSTAVVPEIVTVARAYSRLGEHGVLWYVLGLAGMGLDRRRRARWRRAAKAVLVAQVGSTAIKLAVGRRRPASDTLPALITTPTGLSFPSSHASGSFAAARAYTPLAGARAMYALAVPMALTRVHLGVHYPSDVLAGAALGTLIGSLGR
jgi:membrane-associated phospholipid phosphatase